MKILKIVLGVILALVLGLLLLGAFSRKDFRATQSTTINAPQSLVFSTVNDLSTWDSWSPWSEMDPTNVTTMGEKYVGAGGYYTWAGEEMGTGKMSITESTPPNSIKTLVNIDGQGNADALFTFEPVTEGTKVSWSFHTHTSFPMNAFMVLMGIEKMIDKDYALGLKLLKAKVEEIAAKTPN